VGAIIRVGIIGQGRSGRNIHGLTLLKMPRKYKVVAVSDQLPERRQRAELEYGCRTCATPAALLRQKDIDLIVNAAPSRLHVPLSVKALEAGFHVLCEKPLARKVAEVDRVVRAAQKSGKVMAVFQNRRYAPVFRQIQKVMESGVLGRIVMIKMAYNGFARRWDWQTMRKHYGGSLLNTGPHALDQALQLFGTDAKPKVTCSMDRANSFGDAEDHVKILLQGRGRPTVDLEISSCSAFPQANCEIYGTRGGLRHDGEGLRWRYFKSQGQPQRALTEAPIQNAAGIPAYCSEELKWRERSWTPSGKKKPENQQYYDMLYNTLSAAAPLEITLEQVRQQVAVMEECHRQNPAARMPKAEW